MLCAPELDGLFCVLPRSHRSQAWASVRLSPLFLLTSEYDCGGVPTSSELFNWRSLSSWSSGKSILNVALDASGEGPGSDFMSSIAICWFILSSSLNGISGGCADGDRDVEGYMFCI